jgi:hypothetical protein
MVLQCYECTGKVSSEARACPHCGAPVLAELAVPLPPAPISPSLSAGSTEWQSTKAEKSLHGLRGWLIPMFFRKRRGFPRFCIALLIASAGIGILDALILHASSAPAPEKINLLPKAIAGVLGALRWITYL